MKIRAGFVSNSSSSSFVVHHSEFESRDVMLLIVADLEELERSDPYEWGENGMTYEFDGTYLHVETHRVIDDVRKIFARNGVDIKRMKALWIND